MKKIAHQFDHKLAVEFISDRIILSSEEDALNIMANSGSDHIILHEENIQPEFFDLSTKLAGDVLQKFTNYRIKLAIVGDFAKYQSKSLKDFIYESNRYRDFLFINSVDEAGSYWKD